jgi:hypothetical protein
MRTTLVIFTLLALFFNGWTQDTDQKTKFSIKLSNLTSFEEFQLVNYWDNVPATSDSYYDFLNHRILNPTIALQIRTKTNNFHEIELINLTIDKIDFIESYYNELYNTTNPRRSYLQTNMNISLKYEYIYTLTKSNEKKFLPSIGLGVNPHFQRITNMPVYSNDWKTDRNIFIIRLQVIPRITYFLTSKLFVDFNLPITIADFKYMNYHIYNHSIIESLKTSEVNKTSFLPFYYCGEIGVGFRF